MTRGPDLEALLEAKPTGRRERELIRRGHAALLAAGPLPELPAALRHPPQVTMRRLPVPTRARPRRRAIVAAAAAALVAAAAGAAYVIADRSAGPVQNPVALHATAAAPDARGTLRIGARDHAGNASLTLRVRGLPALPAGSYYRMYLTNKGRLVGSCGTFHTDGGETVVHLNVPYKLGEYSGWLIKREHLGQQPSAPLLTTDM